MFSDKLTKAIAEAAKTVMAKTNETYPDAASTSIYADKAGDAPISDVEASMDRKMTDEGTNDDIKPGTELRTNAGVYCVVDSMDEHDSDYAWCTDEDGDELHVNLNSADVVKGGAPLRDREDQDHMRLGEDAEDLESLQGLLDNPDEESAKLNYGSVEAYKKMIQSKIDKLQPEVTDEEISEALKKSQPASEWITDFVNSKDAKFKGKSKGERINMALGAFYAAQAGKSVKEGVEEPRAQGEKNFKAAHVIVKTHDVNQDDQSGTGAMDQNAKPKLPVGTAFSKAEDVDGEKINDKTAADIKSSGKRATAPKASGAGKFTYADGTEVYAKTAAAIKKSAQGATAPKASGSKQSGAQSAEKVSNSAPSGKLSAEYPKAGQKRAEAMPKGLKEMAMAALLGEDAIKACMSSFDKQYANDNEKALKRLLSGQGTEGIDSRLLPQLNKFITAYGDELKKHLGLPIVDGEKKDVAEAIDSAVDRDDTGAFKGGSKQAGSMSSNDDESDLTVVPDKTQNSVVTALNDLQLALDRCHGMVSRSESYANPKLSMQIKKIHDLLADVAEELDSEPVKETYGENSYSLSDVQSKFGAETMDLINVQGNTIIAVDDYGYEGLQINRFENVENAKKYVQMVSSSTRDSDKSGATIIIDGPDTVYGPFEIKKIG